MHAIQTREVADRFVQFSNSARRFLHIRTQKDYRKTLELVEELMEVAEDSESDPLNDLIGLLAFAIERYEMRLDDVMAFHEEAEETDASVSALRFLMDQHDLGAADLKEEIGSRSLVSMILSGQRSLTKEHIARFSQRFHVSPAIFFGEPNTGWQATDEPLPVLAFESRDRGPKRT